MRLCEILVLIVTIIPINLANAKESNITYVERDEMDSWYNHKGYFVQNIDIQNNNKYRQVVSSKLDGRLLFFISTESGFQSIVDTTNFSVDGGEQFVKIVPVVFPASEQKDSKNPLVMTIITAKQQHEFRHNIRYISKEDNWQLASSEYFSHVMDENNLMVNIRCQYNYENLVLDHDLAKNFPDNTVVINSYNQPVDEVLKNDKHCTTTTIR